MYYTFQESKIWESGDPVDDSRKPIVIRARSEQKARDKIKQPGLGRNWVLIKTEPK